jgi:chromate transport protein ChrA
MMEIRVENTKTILDWASVGTAIATVAGWLPSIAALLTIIWTGLRILDDPRVQALIQWVRRKLT